MSTTTTPVRVDSLPPIAGHEYSIDCIRHGMGDAVADLDTGHSFDGKYNHEPEHPALWAWQAVIDEAIAEIQVEVAGMLDAAIAKRLPWTWEPER